MCKIYHSLSQTSEINTDSITLRVKFTVFLCMSSGTEESWEGGMCP